MKRRTRQINVETDAFEQERLIVRTSEIICAKLKDKGMNKAMLAKELGNSRPYVTKLLDGTTNMTLRTLSRIMAILGQRVEITIRPLNSGIRPIPCVPPREYIVSKEGPYRFPICRSNVSPYLPDRIAG